MIPAPQIGPPRPTESPVLTRLSSAGKNSQVPKVVNGGRAAVMRGRSGRRRGQRACRFGHWDETNSPLDTSNRALRARERLHSEIGTER